MGNPRVTTVDLENKTVALSDGRSGVVTNMFGVDAEETDDPDLCVSFVVKVCDDLWIADFMDRFEPAKKH
jgi:hypothetical protein